MWCRWEGCDKGGLWDHWPPDVWHCWWWTLPDPLGCSRIGGCRVVGGLEWGSGAHRQSGHKHTMVIKSHDSYVLVCTEESCNMFGCEELYLSGCEADLLCTFISSTLKNDIFVNAGSEQNLRQDRLHASAWKISLPPFSRGAGEEEGGERSFSRFRALPAIRTHTLWLTS